MSPGDSHTPMLDPIHQQQCIRRLISSNEQTGAAITSRSPRRGCAVSGPGTAQVGQPSYASPMLFYFGRDKPRGKPLYLLGKFVGVFCLVPVTPFSMTAREGQRHWLTGRDIPPTPRCGDGGRAAPESRRRSFSCVGSFLHSLAATLDEPAQTDQRRAEQCQRGRFRD